MLVLNSTEVRQALPMDKMIESMKQAFAALSGGQCEVPMRTQLSVRPHEGVSLVMPVFVDDRHGQALTVKVVSVFPRNRTRDLPLIHAAVLVLDPKTGGPMALLEGGTVTAIRTGAASGAATDLLANPQCRTVAIFGAGTQARTQLEAVCTVRQIQTVWIYGPTSKRVAQFVAEVTGQGPIPDDVRAAASPEQAVADADIICTATTSNKPVFADRDLKPGVHVNAVGSYQPDVQEIPAETVVKSRLVVDHREAALSEAGDLIQPIKQGLIHSDHIHAELGELILGRAEGRHWSGDRTLFKSVGVAVQDAYAARLALRQAAVLDLGQNVRW